MQGIAAKAFKTLALPDLIERRAFLAGEWIPRDKTLPVIDPANGDHLLDVSACSLEDADAAVVATG